MNQLNEYLYTDKEIIKIKMEVDFIAVVLPYKLLHPEIKIELN